MPLQPALTFQSGSSTCVPMTNLEPRKHILLLPRLALPFPLLQFLKGKQARPPAATTAAAATATATAPSTAAQRCYLPPPPAAPCAASQGSGHGPGGRQVTPPLCGQACGLAVLAGQG